MRDLKIWDQFSRLAEDLYLAAIHCSTQECSVRKMAELLRKRAGVAGSSSSVPPTTTKEK